MQKIGSCKEKRCSQIPEEEEEEEDEQATWSLRGEDLDFVERNPNCKGTIEEVLHVKQLQRLTKSVELEKA